MFVGEYIHGCWSVHRKGCVFCICQESVQDRKDGPYYGMPITITLLMSLDPEREYIIEGAIGEGFKYERNPNV